MNIREYFHRWQRQHREHAAWRLLAADNAPFILAFVQSLFAETAEVSFSKAKLALEAELSSWGDGVGLSGNFTAYLRQWIQAGWLREQDEILTRTDACEQALRFAQSLEQRDMVATASRLRIVQEEVRDLSIVLSPNINERIRLLEYKREQINREIESLNAGIIEELPADQKRERIRNLYSMARDLTGDFRRLEDEIRLLDRALRVKMIESEQGRGEVLEVFLAKQSILSDTYAGRAFDGFFDMLCHPNRNSEFREQIRSILSRDLKEFLAPNELRYLGQLVRELTRESDRVIEVRRRTQESLRGYIENHDFNELQTINRYLRELERLAVSFKEHGVNFNQKTSLRLLSGRFHAVSPAFELAMPQDSLQIGPITAHINGTAPSDNVLNQMQTIKIREVAAQLRGLVLEKGPLTIAQSIALRPINGGLEELVACIRIARATDAIELVGGDEIIIFKDRGGTTIRAHIPRLMLSLEGFPENIEDLML